MDGRPKEIKLRFHDGLVWTVNRRNKAPFSPVGLTVEIKLRCRDGLVWTVA